MFRIKYPIIPQPYSIIHQPYTQSYNEHKAHSLSIQSQPHHTVRTYRIIIHQTISEAGKRMKAHLMLHRLMWVNLTTRSCCKKSYLTKPLYLVQPSKITVPYEVDFTPLNVSTLSFSSQSGWHGGHISILYLLAILIQQTPLLPSSVGSRKYLRGYCGPPLRRERGGPSFSFRPKISIPSKSSHVSRWRWKRRESRVMS